MITLKFYKMFFDASNTTILLSLATAVIGAWFISICWSYLILLVQNYNRSKYLDTIAMAPKRHWFYGHLMKFGGASEESLLNRTRLPSTYPVMYNFWRGPFKSSVTFHHPDSAKAFLSSGAPKDNFGYWFVIPWLGDGLLTSKGKKWQRNRHLLTPAFHFNILKPYTLIYNETSRIMLAKWEKEVGKPLEIHEPVSLMTLDTMLQCAMSSKTDCQHVKGKHLYIRAIRTLADGILSRAHNPLYWSNLIYKLSPAGRRFYEAADLVHSHADKIIKQRRRILSQSSNGNPKHENESHGSIRKNTLDFLDILLETKDEEGNGLSDREIRDEVDTFLFEGHDTTASGISWALYNLAKYPDYQDKCRSEVCAVIDQKPDVEWDDLKKLPYLTMLIKESLRLYPPVIMIGRQLEKPLKIQSEFHQPNEVLLPKNSEMALDIFSLHRNENIWENPNVFDPERFNKENCSKRHSHAYVPFAAGSRNCIGQNFAMNEMKVTLAQAIRKYKFFLDAETLTPCLQPRLTLQSKDGVYVKISRIATAS